MSDTLFVPSTVELIDYMGDDKRACHAARVSLLNDEMESDAGLNARDIKLLEFLMREKHTSPFEHSVITFRVYAPLPVVAQIMRHRTFSYNMASRRYSSDDIQLYDMGAWRKQGDKNLQCSEGVLKEQDNPSVIYHAVSTLAFNAYEDLLRLGVSREQARFVLPQGLMARFYMTGNLHNYMKFLVLRDDEHAQPECRDVAAAMRDQLQSVFPETMDLFNRLLKK